MKRHGSDLDFADAHALCRAPSHDMGVDTRSDAPETNLVPSLGVDGWCPAWMCISTMRGWDRSTGHGRPRGARNEPKALTPAPPSGDTQGVPLSHRDEFQQDEERDL